MRKIALVGTAGSGAKAPYDDPDHEIWGVSARADYVRRADRWFELHRLDGEPQAWADKWRKDIKTQMADIPSLWMLFPEPGLHGNVIRYPAERIVQRFGTYHMSSTFAWMMALAIDELRPMGGAPIDGEIGIFGVEMEYGTEYRQQRSGFRHFIDLARFAGIAVSRLASGGLAYEPVPYPMWQDDPLLNKLELKIRDHNTILDDSSKLRHKTHLMIQQNQAVIAELEDLKQKPRKKRYDFDKRLERRKREIANLMATFDNLDREMQTKRAAVEELCWMRDYVTT